MALFYFLAMKDLKYLFAYTIPLAAYVSFSSSGLGSFAAVIYAFVVIPFFDVIFGQNHTNPSDNQQKARLSISFLIGCCISIYQLFWVAVLLLFSSEHQILHNAGVGLFIIICRNIIGNQRHQCCT